MTLAEKTTFGPSTLGEKIATLRKRQGLTQDAFAKKIGVHSNHITRWESNRMRPSVQMLEKIAAVFGVTTDRLLDAQALAAGVGLGGNQELVEKMEQLQELDEEDRAMVFRMIDSLSTLKRMGSMWQHRHQTGSSRQ